jgi:NhaA family Na+:H+ antiporter
MDEKTRAILDQYPSEINNHHDQEHADHEALLLSEIARESVSPLNRMELSLVAWSSFLIVPIFALANAGVNFREIGFTEAMGSTVALGVTAGLVVGKLIGITGFTWAAVRLNIGKLPPGTGWGHIVGLSAVAGIGFTVSLFVAGLAFTDPHLTDLAKVGIFAGSVVSGVVGTVVLLLAKPPSDL